MKKLRRISILALVIVLVCAFSASAFAYSDYVEFDSDNRLHVYADMDQISVDASLSLEAIAMQNSALEITCIYDYKYHNNTPGSLYL